MLTTTYYNVYETIPATALGNPYVGGKERLVNHHDKFYTEAEAQECLDAKREHWHDYLKEQLHLAEDADMIDHLQTMLDGTTYEIKKEVVEYTHACEHLWSDVIAYEIVRVVSENTLEIRRMISDIVIDDEVQYPSAPDHDVIRIRRKKNNPEAWGKGNLRFTLNTKPYAYRDPHF